MIQAREQGWSGASGFREATRPYELALGETYTDQFGNEHVHGQTDVPKR